MPGAPLAIGEGFHVAGASPWVDGESNQSPIVILLDHSSLASSSFIPPLPQFAAASSSLVPSVPLPPSVHDHSSVVDLTSDAELVDVVDSALAHVKSGLDGANSDHIADDIR